MTSFILLIAGIGLIWSGNWGLGIIILLCSAEVSNKDSKISKLENEIALLKPKEKK
jgi:hypothetical protein